VGASWSRKERLVFLRSWGVGDDGLIISLEIISTFVVAITFTQNLTRPLNVYASFLKSLKLL